VGGADAVARAQCIADCRCSKEAAAKEVALRWSALTRPVAYASGASIVAGYLAVPSGATEKSHCTCLTEVYRIVTFVDYSFFIYHFFRNASF